MKKVFAMGSIVLLAVSLVVLAGCPTEESEPSAKERSLERLDETIAAITNAKDNADAAASGDWYWTSDAYKAQKDTFLTSLKATKTTYEAYPDSQFEEWEKEAKEAAGDAYKETTLEENLETYGIKKKA
jgi:Ni,Fe-hydrogenase I large subunit